MGYLDDWKRNKDNAAKLAKSAGKKDFKIPPVVLGVEGTVKAVDEAKVDFDKAKTNAEEAVKVAAGKLSKAYAAWTSESQKVTTGIGKADFDLDPKKNAKEIKSIRDALSITPAMLDRGAKKKLT